ncbi:G patch domain and ankyrin repeat-containing protein 1 homolog [Spodoptera litura]|uniref:G patch domain and ankyrin repeat-containing protein 1 homolog n=1 Tax=Spodoptera litura TaxID=69820 RepID=A0A9J7E6J7_SPOLT|nr:G patch domain and ankyrin repeat-containing protein 1 homolog [Spodoptera litura]
MSDKIYSNFVKASSPVEDVNTKQDITVLSGEEARKLYLEEVKHAKAPSRIKTHGIEKKKKVTEEETPLSNKDLFLTVQNNDIDKLKCELDRYPDKLNIVDEFGWNLLMIACQVNSVDVVKLLLKRGIDMSVRDKAGNSARSLVIKNKNYILADILLRYIQKESPLKSKPKQTSATVKLKEEYLCNACNKTFPDREEHLSSTIHNITASKGKKIPACYMLPETNRGYQLMLKGGWDKQSGLGRDGNGKLYPIKTVQKKDRKGLGHAEQNPIDKTQDNVKHKNRMKLARDHRSDKSFEIKFRREFY